MNAHFLSGAPQKVDFKFCSPFGKKKGVNLGRLPMKSKLNAQELVIQILAENMSANKVILHVVGLKLTSYIKT